MKYPDTHLGHSYGASVPSSEEMGLMKKTPSQQVRPELEVFLQTATPEQRIALDEFAGVLSGDGDGGCFWTTLEWCFKLGSHDFLMGIIKDYFISKSSQQVMTAEEFRDSDLWTQPDPQDFYLSFAEAYAQYYHESKSGK